MVSVRKELVRLTRTLVWRGGLMLLLGLSAAVWPEQALVQALLGVAAVAALSGIYELSVGVAMRGKAPHWRMAATHGAAIVAFGLITAGVAAVVLRVALFAIALWFVAYALLAFRASRLVPHTSRARPALFLWAAANAGVAIFALAYPGTTIFAVLFLGAIFAALLGAWQLAAGLWLRRAASVAAEPIVATHAQRPA